MITLTLAGYAVAGCFLGCIALLLAGAICQGVQTSRQDARRICNSACGSEEDIAGQQEIARGGLSVRDLQVLIRSDHGVFRCSEESVGPSPRVVSEVRRA